jgi:hypothetical protein
VLGEGFVLSSFSPRRTEELKDGFECASLKILLFFRSLWFSFGFVLSSFPLRRTEELKDGFESIFFKILLFFRSSRLIFTE